MEETLFWSKEGKKIRCNICSFSCLMDVGEFGRCKMRYNEKNVLKVKNYGKIKNVQKVSIETLPLYHFLPGYDVLLLSTIGNNIEWKIALDEKIKGSKIKSEDIIKEVNSKKIKIIAFNDGEPLISFETVFKIARLAKRYNIRTILSTNGFISSETIKKIGKYLDAAIVKILASADKKFYQKYLNVDETQPIFDTLKNFKKHRVFVEVVNTIIPEIGEDETSHVYLVDWLINNLDSSVPYHLMKFEPFGKFEKIPETPPELFEKFVFEAEKSGLRFVYVHDPYVAGYSTTYCYNCRFPLIERLGGAIIENRLDGDRCPSCGFKINIIVE
ncbi:MAG: 4Fe-4S cluster-binding domain-containing protein [Candidatus Aenigmarchaeota archaeon]|nr:4Fe-4S cluster-binding domain-containing protein [Candidatus Aenigmarchaeota archaeon]MCX8179563.1 4Fe-4S cluster-binding domain-containing protein [Candidatus Aenigmarchaeota archaeon]